MDNEHSERDDFDDMMDMNVTLSREELITAQAALQMSKEAMSILKVEPPPSYLPHSIFVPVEGDTHPLLLPRCYP